VYINEETAVNVQEAHQQVQILVDELPKYLEAHQQKR